MFSDNWISFYAGRIIDDRLQLISTAAIFSGCSCCICLAPVDVLKILHEVLAECVLTHKQWPVLAASSGSYLICNFGLCVSVTITVSLRCLFWIMVLEKKISRGMLAASVLATLAVPFILCWCSDYRPVRLSCSSSPGFPWIFPSVSVNLVSIPPAWPGGHREKHS